MKFLIDKKCSITSNNNDSAFTVKSFIENGKIYDEDFAEKDQNLSQYIGGLNTYSRKTFWNILFCFIGLILILAIIVAVLLGIRQCGENCSNCWSSEKSFISEMFNTEA